MTQSLIVDPTELRGLVGVLGQTTSARDGIIGQAGGTISGVDRRGWNAGELDTLWYRLRRRSLDWGTRLQSESRTLAWRAGLADQLDTWLGPQGWPSFGEPGMPGPEGFPGPDGFPGPVGPRPPTDVFPPFGEPGFPGLPGMPGIPGMPGPEVFPGPEGRPGPFGGPGPEVLPGPDDFPNPGEFPGPEVFPTPEPRPGGNTVYSDDGEGQGQGDGEGNGDGEPLPNADDAEVDPSKFRDYSLDPNNDNNDDKHKAFEELGYDVNSQEGRDQATQDVEQQLREHLPEAPAQPGKSTEYGDRYEVETPIKGPNGKEGTLVTVWQVDKGSDHPRLITNWVKVHR